MKRKLRQNLQDWQQKYQISPFHFPYFAPDSLGIGLTVSNRQTNTAKFLSMKKTVLPFALISLIAWSYKPVFNPLDKEVQSERPNVVFIVIDDMNMIPILKNYPNLKTPNIDKLASESYNFRHAVCTVPLCTPSQAAFFSGIAPWKTGVYRNYHNIYTASILSQKELLPECFKRNGYIMQ